eukprot:scpid35856/ scgid17081/ 
MEVAIQNHQHTRPDIAHTNRHHHHHHHSRQRQQNKPHNPHNHHHHQQQDQVEKRTAPTVQVFLPTRKFTAPRTPDNGVYPDEDSPDFPSPPSFVDNFKEEAKNDQPGKINNLELSDSSHSLDNHEQDADILCLDKEKPSSKKCRPNPFSNDNELLSDNVTPLILAGVRDKLMKMKLNHELPSESSSLGEFSADTNSVGDHGDSTDSPVFAERHSEPRPSVVYQAAPGVFLSMPTAKKSSQPAPSKSPMSDPSTISTRRESTGGGVFITGLSDKFMPPPQPAFRKTPSPLPQLTEGKVAKTERNEHSNKQSAKDNGIARNSKSPSLGDINEKPGSNVFVSMPRSSKANSLPRMPRRYSMPSFPQQLTSPGMSTFISLGQSREDLATGGRSSSHSTLGSDVTQDKPSFNKSMSQPDGDTASTRQYARSGSHGSIFSQTSPVAENGSGSPVFFSMPRGAMPPRGPVGSLPRGTSMPSFTTAATPRMNTYTSLGKRSASTGGNNGPIGSSSASTMSHVTASKPKEEKKSRWKSLDNVFFPKRGRKNSSATSTEHTLDESTNDPTLDPDMVAAIAEAQQLRENERRRSSSSVFMAMSTMENTSPRSARPQRQQSARELGGSQERRRGTLLRRRASTSTEPVMLVSLGWK